MTYGTRNAYIGVSSLKKRGDKMADTIEWGGTRIRLV